MHDPGTNQRARKKITDESNRYNVVIVEDHPLMRSALREMIEREPDLAVCGEADGIATGLDQVRRTRPDLVIIDITLVDGNGLDLIKQLRATDDESRILVLSLHDESLYAERVIRAGALGYVNKRAAPPVIMEAVRRVLEGRVYVSGAVADDLLHRLTGRSRPADPMLGQQLSDRELEVFEMLGRGLSVAAIAENLCLSVKTVETYRHRIKQKIGVTTSNELIARAAVWIAQQG